MAAGLTEINHTVLKPSLDFPVQKLIHICQQNLLHNDYANIDQRAGNILLVSYRLSYSAKEELQIVIL